MEPLTVNLPGCETTVDIALSVLKIDLSASGQSRYRESPYDTVFLP
jgi:hypothetical protein